jgi:hypothetical protein
LRFLAKKHHLEVKGEIVEELFTSYRKAPTKSQYIKKMSGKVTKAELTALEKSNLEKSKVRTDNVVGLGKVQTYLTKQGYEISSKKRGFDVIGVDDSSPVQDRYLAVGFNQERTVSGEYVLKFKKKVRAFYEKISDDYTFGPPHVEGLIAYTGMLSKDAPVVVKASKPAIKFKKF